MKPAAFAHGLWAVLWRVGLFFVVWGLLLAPTILPFRSAMERWQQEGSPWPGWLGDASALLSLLAATWAIGRLADRRSLGSWGLGAPNRWWVVAAGPAVGIAWLGASVAGACAVGVASLSPAPLPSWVILLATAGSVLINATAQQVLLCGYIFGTIRSRFGTSAAVIASALLFSGYHAGAFKGAWVPALNVFLAGLVFCEAFVLTETIWFGTAFHATWNFLLGPVLGLTVSGTGRFKHLGRLFALSGSPVLSGGDFGIEGGVIVTATTLLVLAALLLALGRRKRADRESETSEVSASS